jgi:hypothetical protein
MCARHILLEPSFQMEDGFVLMNVGMLQLLKLLIKAN